MELEGHVVLALEDGLQAGLVGYVAPVRSRMATFVLCGEILAPAAYGQAKVARDMPSPRHRHA